MDGSFGRGSFLLPFFFNFEESLGLVLILLPRDYCNKEREAEERHRYVETSARKCDHKENKTMERLCDCVTPSFRE